MPVFLIGLAVLACDQIAKWLVATQLTPGQRVPLVPGVFEITYTLNPGAAFGILPERTNLFIGLTLVVMGLILYIVRRHGAPGAYVALALGLALGGAAGNLVDRLYRGAVLDFLDVRVWPVFNLADVAIVLGAVLLVWQLVREPAAHRGAREDR